MTHEVAIQSALNVMQAHIDALNARDEAALAETLHFPHFRLSGTVLMTWETPATYFEDFRARAGGNWAHSRFEDIQVSHAASDKVHLDARIVRFDQAGEVIASFRSLWVITCEDGDWAAKFRSSFAAK